MSALDRQRVEQERIKLEEQIQEVRGHSLIKKKPKQLYPQTSVYILER